MLQLNPANTSLLTTRLISVNNCVCKHKPGHLRHLFSKVTFFFKHKSLRTMKAKIKTQLKSQITVINFFIPPKMQLNDKIPQALLQPYHKYKMNDICLAHTEVHIISFVKSTRF